MKRPRPAVIVALGLLVAGSGGLAVFAWPGLVLGTAALSAETRPALLRDVGWGRASSASQFKARFQAGSAASDLLEWLRAHDFIVDLAGQRATRDIRAVPCQERLTVNWQADQRGNLIDANAVIAEAGCL